MAIKKVKLFGMLLFVVLIVFSFSQAFLVMGERSPAVIDEFLLNLARDSPEAEIKMVLALDTNNEGLLEEIRRATKDIDDEISNINEDFGQRFSNLKEELGYDESEEEILTLFREDNKNFREKYQSLERKYGLTEKEREEATNKLDDLRTKRTKIIYSLLSKKYQPIQDRMISKLKNVENTEIIFQDLATNKLTIKTKAKNTKQIGNIQGIDEIIYGEYPDTDELDKSVPTIGAPTWHNNGYGGFPYDLLLIGNAGGIYTAHPSLDHITWISQCFFPGPCDPTNPTNGHDTAVAGIMGSNHATYGGVSPVLDKFYNGLTDSFSQSQEAVSWALSSTDTPEDITMSKYWSGSSPPYCGDRIEEEYVDEIVDLFDIPWIKSAGNQGDNPNQNVTLPAGAYNIVAVGASYDQSTVSRADDEIWSGSSRGPVYVCDNDETRIKPDIVAPGRSIISTTIGGGFAASTGTSNAAPHVTGSLLLIQSYHGSLYSSKELRALLFNTAEDRLESNGAPGNDGPDNTWGYGYLDMDKAYFEADDTDNINLIGNGDIVFLKSSPAIVNDKATIVWNRHIIGNDGVTNNLDLYLYDEGTNNLIDDSTYVGRNIEQVVYNANYPSSIVKVNLEDLNTGSFENFGIAMNNQFSQVNPPAISGDIEITPPVVDCSSGALIDVVVPILNTGDITMHGVTADLALPAGFTLVSGNNPQNIGSIPAGSSENATWLVQTGGIGNTALGVDISSLSYGELLQQNCMVNVPVCLNSVAFTGATFCS